jgi:hypothetical protein
VFETHLPAWVDLRADGHDKCGTGEDKACPEGWVIRFERAEPGAECAGEPEHDDELHGSDSRETSEDVLEDEHAEHHRTHETNESPDEEHEVLLLPPEREQNVGTCSQKGKRRKLAERLGLASPGIEPIAESDRIVRVKHGSLLSYRGRTPWCEIAFRGTEHFSNSRDRTIIA